MITAIRTRASTCIVRLTKILSSTSGFGTHRTRVVHRYGAGCLAWREDCLFTHLRILTIGFLGDNPKALLWIQIMFFFRSSESTIDALELDRGSRVIRGFDASPRRPAGPLPTRWFSFSSTSNNEGLRFQKPIFQRRQRNRKKQE